MCNLANLIKIVFYMSLQVTCGYHAGVALSNSYFAHSTAIVASLCCIVIVTCYPVVYRADVKARYGHRSSALARSRLSPVTK